MAAAETSWRINGEYADHGMQWDDSGKNAHYAPIDWSN